MELLEELDHPFYRERIARGRVRWSAMRDRWENLCAILDEYFDDEVANNIGGVFWGAEQRIKALVNHEDGLMYFNARAPRSMGDLFMDVVHEWTHIKSDIWEHDRDFGYAVECETARRLRKLFA